MSIQAAFTQIDAKYTTKVVSLAAVRTGWAALLLALTLVIADATFAFGNMTRLTIDIALALALITIAVGTHLRLHRTTSAKRMVARMLEEGHPWLDNALVNALDFEDKKDEEHEQEITQGLMEREIDRAAEKIGRIPDYAALTPKTFKKESQAFAAMALLWVIAIFVFSGVFLAVLPRYAFPFGDFPPYSATKFAVTPGATQVDYGENLKISVTASGEIPANLSLILLDQNGRESTEIAMFDMGEGAFFQTIENVREPLQYFARAGKARSKRYPVTVATQPRIEDVIVTLNFPEYTRLDPRVRILTEGIIRGYPGTQVTMTIRSNRPLKGGTLEQGGQQHAFRKSVENTVETTFTIEKGGLFTAKIVDIDGNRSKEGFRGEIQLTTDLRPEVTIVSPGMDSFAVPDAKIPIRIEASDDLGITKIAVFRNHNDSIDAKKGLYDTDGEESYVTITETLDLKDLGVRPGDFVDYYVTASDSLPESPQTMASPSFRLQIISFEEYREYMQARTTATDLREKYDEILEQFEQLAAKQKEVQEDIDALKDKAGDGQPMTEADKANLAQAQRMQAALARAAEAMAARLMQEAEQPAIFDIEESYKDALKEFAERLKLAQGHMGKAGQHMAQAAKPGQGGSKSLSSASDEQSEAMKQLAQNIEDFKDGIQQAGEHLERVTWVMGDVENFKYLYTLQKGLERQIRYYKAIEDPALDEQVRLKELSEQQAAVREALSELKDSLRLHADELDELAKEQQANEAAGEPTP